MKQVTNQCSYTASIRCNSHALTDWLTDWWTDGQTDGRTDWLSDWLIDWLIFKLIASDWAKDLTWKISHWWNHTSIQCLLLAVSQNETIQQYSVSCWPFLRVKPYNNTVPLVGRFSDAISKLSKINYGQSSICTQIWPWRATEHNKYGFFTSGAQTFSYQWMNYTCIMVRSLINHLINPPKAKQLVMNSTFSFLLITNYFITYPELLC